MDDVWYPPHIEIQDHIREIIKFIGENPEREGLRKTPERMVKSWKELFSGYHQNVEEIFTVFEDDCCDEMVVLKQIEMYSFCEHHMLPFFGKASIAYIPNGKVVGISKLARVLEVFSRRLQIQERLCEQVTGALEKHLQPKGTACVIEAHHLCMMARGVSKQNSVMITSSLTGAFRLPEVRTEFFQLVSQ